MIDRLIHCWLRVPYTLKIHHRIHGGRRARHTLLFIHGIGNSGAVWGDVIEKLPPGVSVLSIDLLGFGDSPRPAWAQYNVATQARSVIATLLKAGLRRRLIIVGHSLGALVAVEVARRYPLIVKHLVLCSPPFYDTAAHKLTQDQVLLSIYEQAGAYPRQFLALARVAMRYQLINRSFAVTDHTIDSYMASLQASIIEQSSLEDAMRLTTPMTIIRGLFDPLVVATRLRALARANPRVRLLTTAAGHEIKGPYGAAVVRALRDAMK